MRTIWKYAFNLSGRTECGIPKGGRFLAFGEQDGTLVGWFEVDEAEPEEKRTFRVFGTGMALPLGAEWRGTVSTEEGTLIWHLFELRATTQARQLAPLTPDFGTMDGFPNETKAR